MDERPSIWMCPVCGDGLARRPRRFACAAGHSFDVAREGYVNLLLPQHRRSARAGDPVDSLRHRRDFLEAGHYRPLAAALAELLPAADPGAVLLDVGCGEGWYLRQLALAADGWRLHGVDVAREAVRLASRASADIDFAVGNGFRLPVRAASVDVALQIFAPAAAAEIERVLRPEGALISVVPGPRHLAAFRRLVYAEQARPHAEAPPPEGFVPRERRLVDCPLVLEGPEAVAGLVEMTPYKWHMDPDTYARVRALERLRDTAQFALTVATPART